MKPVELPAPLEVLEIAGHRYEVEQITLDDFKALWGCICIMAGKTPATPEERRQAQALLAYGLIRHGAPNLSLEFVTEHLSADAATAVSLEYKRQMFFLLPTAGAT